MQLTFFHIQLAFESPPDDPWRRELRELIAGLHPRQSANDKRAFYGRFTRVVAGRLPQLRRVCWDLVRTSSARSEFDEWVADLEDTSDVPGPSRGDGEPRHQVVTFLVLATRGRNADRALGDVCDLPEEVWLTRRTIAGLIAVLPVLSYTSVAADAVYLQPGLSSPASVQPGMTAEELDVGWDHLAAVTG